MTCLNSRAKKYTGILTLTVQSLNLYPVDRKWPMESPKTVINNVSNKIVVLRDSVGNYIFVDSDNSNVSHFSIYDSKGINLIKRGSLPIDKFSLIEYLQKTFDYTLERG